MFSLDAGKKITVKTIADKTSVPLTGVKEVTDPYFVVKIPISYYELKMGTFKESEKKTVNYCVSYKPKKPTTTTPATTTPTPATTPATTPTTPPKVETPKTTTPVTPPKTVTPPTPETTELNSAEDAPVTEKVVDDANTGDEGIPSYNAKPVQTLNSADTDPTRVAAGPAENMFIVIAALLVATLLFPKLNRVFEK